MNAEPQNEHKWLQRLVGDWTFEAVCESEPGKPPSRHLGTESVRSLGGLWTVGEGRGEMPGGGEATTIMTLGFDPERKLYVGTFIGSMMTHLWQYEGSLDAAGKVLALNTLGPDFFDGRGLVRYIDAIEFVSDDERILTSSVLRADGTWQKFMTATYRRRR